jgi:phosphate/sulfate permease
MTTDHYSTASGHTSEVAPVWALPLVAASLAWGVGLEGWRLTPNDLRHALSSLPALLDGF